MNGRKTNRKNEESLVPYSHAIVCCYCVVRKFSPTGSAVRTVHIGTLIEIHDVQKDNILFCIVKNNTPDNDLFLCKKTDILFVPENLWGPLLAVKEDKRLPIVQCEELAEAIGNLTVGSPVKVLGSDSKDVCFGTITFKNNVTKLGVGIYFGLKIKCPEKNLDFIKEKFSLLEPGTKGFPRGCDIVVSADRVIPLSYENRFTLGDENYFANDGNMACESKLGSDSKDKDGGNLKSSQYGNAFDMSLEKWKNKGTSIPLSSGEKVVFLHGDKAEVGTVKWFGYIKNSMKVGVEFENPIGSGTGTVEGVEFFKTKYLHAGFFPPESLIKLSDFYKDALEDFDYQQSSSNNGSFTESKAKDSPHWSWTHDFGTTKVKKNKYKYIQYPHSLQRTSYLYSCSFENDLEGKWEYCSSYTTECSACSSFTERVTNYCEMMKARERKSFSVEQSDFNDNDLQEKQFVRNSTGRIVSGGASPNTGFLEDFTEDRKCRSRSVDNDAYKDFNFGDFKYAKHENQSGSSQYDKKTGPANKGKNYLFETKKPLDTFYPHSKKQLHPYLHTVFTTELYADEEKSFVDK